MRTVRVLVLVLVGMVVLSACRIDARVSVQVDDDGSGAVRVRVVLDREAVRIAQTGGASLEERVRLDDLPAAGWRVVPWNRRPDGSAALELRRPFSSPDELERVMADLNGDDGPLRGVRLGRSRDPVRTTFGFRALGDLAGIESGVAGDDELAANLTGQRVDVEGIDAALTGRLRDALRMNVAVALPGGGTSAWHLAPGTRKVLATSSSQVDLARAAWLGLGIVLGGATLGLVFYGEWKARRRRRIAEPRPGDGASAA